MSDQTSQNLRRNTRASMISWVWSVSMNILRVPILYAFLTEPEYGLWFLAFRIVLFFTVQNFGLSTALVNYTAQYHAKGDYRSLNARLGTGFFFSALMVSVLFGVFCFLLNPILDWLNIFELREVGRFILIGVAISTCLSVISENFDAVLIGTHRIDVRNFSRCAVLTVELIALWICLVLGLGIKSVVILNVLGVASYIVLLFFMKRKYAPEIHLNPLQARVSLIGELFANGGKMQLLGFTALAMALVDSMLLTRVAGITFIGIYGVAQRVGQRAQSAALAGFGALVPASADLFARNEHERLRAVYETALTFTALGCTWIFGYLSVFSDISMRIFMGEKYNVLASYTLLVFSVAYFFHALTGPGASMLRGAGKPFQEMTYHIITTIVFVVMLAPYLTGEKFIAPPLEVSDITMAEHSILTTFWPIALSLGSLAFVILSNRFFRAHWLAPFNKLFIVMAAALGISTSLRWIWINAGIPFPENRWGAVAGVLVSGTTYTILFFIACWKLPGLSAENKGQAIRFVPGGSKILSKLKKTT